MSFILEPLYKIYSQVRFAVISPCKHPRQDSDVSMLLVFVSLNVCSQSVSRPCMRVWNAV